MNTKPILLSLTILLFAACGNNHHKHGRTALNPGEADFSDTFVYKKSSKYKSVLIDCIRAETENDSCSLETLPFLAQEKKVPTKEMIMERVVVSHQWMGDRFAEMLDLLDDDMKILLGAVTAIVIDDDIIPSYYNPLTGTIYLEPSYLWLTPAEAATITPKEDFRAEYSNDLQFFELGLFFIDNKLAFNPFPDESIPRTKEDIKFNLADLLYHELAHANDYFPPYLRDDVTKSDSVIEALDSIYAQSISHKLYENYPLTSDELKAMGQVMFHGEKANREQKAITATQMGELFSHGSAVMMYGYSKAEEDTATLFENLMMKRHYNMEQDYAFIDILTNEDNATCDDYIVGWGVRNRIANDDVKQRANFIFKKIFPNITPSDNLGKSQLLRTQVGLCTSIYNNQSKSTQKQKSLRHQSINPNDFKIRPL